MWTYSTVILPQKILPAPENRHWHVSKEPTSRHSPGRWTSFVSYGSTSDSRFSKTPSTLTSSLTSRYESYLLVCKISVTSRNLNLPVVLHMVLLKWQKINTAERSSVTVKEEGAWNPAPVNSHGDTPTSRSLNSFICFLTKRPTHKAQRSFPWELSCKPVENISSQFR